MSQGGKEAVRADDEVVAASEVRQVIRSPKTGPFRVRVFRGIFPWLGGAEDDEGITVLGRAEGVHSQAGKRRCSGCWHCRKAGISQATYFNWKKKYEGLQPPEMRRLKQLGDENTKLKKIVADLPLDREMLQDVIRRKL
jgi:putative transposase